MLLPVEHWALYIGGRRTFLQHWWISQQDDPPGMNSHLNSNVIPILVYFTIANFLAKGQVEGGLASTSDLFRPRS